MSLVREWKSACRRRRDEGAGQKVVGECASRCRGQSEKRTRRSARLHLTPAGARRRPRDLARLASARCEVDRRMYAAHNQQMLLVLLFMSCTLRTCYGADDLAYPSD